MGRGITTKFMSTTESASVMLPVVRYPVQDFVHCGVYFLYDGSALQYIGQSVNILARIEQHMRALNFMFDSYSFLRCEPSALDVMEQTFIRTFKPKHNTTFNLFKDEVPVIRTSVERQDAPLKQWMTTPDAADYLSVSASYLEKVRVHGGGPTYAKVGKSVRYNKSQLDEWVAKKGFQNTSMYEPAK